jgi:hypothetical protein
MILIISDMSIVVTRDALGVAKANPALGVITFGSLLELLMLSATFNDDREKRGNFH